MPTELAPQVVVMGVCGCGKSSVGERLASALQLRFVEGDNLHPQANIERMAQGIALSDADRAGWLDAVAGELGAADGVVVACSALKRRYRDRLRIAAPSLRFVFLHGSPALLEQRLGERRGHYMRASLLQSQLDALEPPGPNEAAIALDVAQAIETLVAKACDFVRRTG